MHEKIFLLKCCPTIFILQYVSLKVNMNILKNHDLIRADKGWILHGMSLTLSLRLFCKQWCDLFYSKLGRARTLEIIWRSMSYLKFLLCYCDIIYTSKLVSYVPCDYPLPPAPVLNIVLQRIRYNMKVVSLPLGTVQ